MSLHTRMLLPLAAGLVALAGSATAQVQQLRFEPIVVSAAPGESLAFDLRYATDPAQPALTGLGLRLHWDSSQVADASFTPAVGQALLGLSTVEPDALDFDANPETDRFVVIAWADPQAGWPGFDQGILGTMSLTLASGFSGITTVGLSSSSTPAGWTLSDIPATITDPSIGVPEPELTFEKRWLSLDGRPGIDFGDEAFFELELVNTGLIGIDAIAISDPLTPDCDRTSLRLLAGERTTWQCSLPGVTASFVNEAVASGSALDNQATPVEVVARAPVTVLDPLLSIDIQPPFQQVRIGDPASFEILVRNDGDEPLDQLQFRSTEVPACDLSLDQLAPGASTTWNCQITGVAQDFVNTVRGSALMPGSTAPTLLNEVGAEVQAIDPSIDLVLDADPAAVEFGQDVRFELRLTNAGNADLTTLEVSSPDDPGCERQFSSLASGTSVEWECTRTAVQGTFTLTVDAIATPPVGDPVTDSASITVEAYESVFRDGFEAAP